MGTIVTIFFFFAMLVSDVEELRHVLKKPQGFLSQLVESLGPAGKKLAVAKLRPKMQYLLQDMGLAWEDVMPAIEMLAGAKWGASQQSLVCLMHSYLLSLVRYALPVWYYRAPSAELCCLASAWHML